MDLGELIRSDAKIEEISAYLDALDRDSRRQETRALNGKLQALLYERAAGSPPLALSDFVPESVQSDREVIHSGRNSQPAFQYFEKRFCRPASRENELWGYNEASARPLIGPGYFVAHPAANSGGDPRGSVVVDYFEVPAGPVPQSWPTIKPNSRGLQMFVYNKMRDYMRGVSSHVSIGAAYRMEKRLMGYFVLCREDEA